MASAIPVPGQPGRLFIPGTGTGLDQAHGTYMKTSDVQMSPQELATLQGLGGDLGQIVRPDASLLARGGLFAANKELVKQAAEIKQQLVANKQAAEQKQQQQQEKPLGDRIMEILKNPYVIGGVVLVLGTVGFFIWKRRRSQQATAQVGAVETLGLEDMKPKRKKRRSKRKSKK